MSLRPVEILWFEDVNPFHEPVFEFPIIGKLSMRQMTIFGIGAMSTWGLYQTSGNIASIIPIVIAVFLAFKKQKVLSVELHFFTILMFYFSKKRTSKIAKISKSHSIRIKSKSPNLGFPEPIDPRVVSVKKETPVREIYADPLRPIRLKIKLERVGGKVISNKQARIVFDNNVVSTLSTDNNGELEAIIIPQTLGDKKIQIFVENIMHPVFEEILSVKQP